MYAALARYYDVLHQSVTDDVPLLLRLAAGSSGPILELGCGTGRLLRPLAEAGFEVWGLDGSPEMLSTARASIGRLPAASRARVTLVEGDMTDFALAPRFGLILVAYNTLMHLPPPAMARALRIARQHLAPGGRLYLDVESPYGIESLDDDGALVLEQSLRLPDTGVWLLHYSCTRVERAEQIARVMTVLDESATAGGPVNRLVTEAEFHYLYPHEIELLLDGAGLRLDTLCGDYDERPFDEDSPRLIALASSRE
jgi:SAM-dependent methyltransferase